MELIAWTLDVMFVIVRSFISWFSNERLTAGGDGGAEPDALGADDDWAEAIMRRFMALFIVRE